MATNQILPWATGGGANVLDQATYSSLGERGTGFLAGVAYSSHANKAIRQATLVAAGIGNFIATVGGVDCLDDGSVSNQTSGLITAIQAQVNSTLQWNATTAYAVGQPVVYNNIFYIALVANTNSAPPNNSWLPYGFGYLSKSVAGGSNVTLSAVESARQVLSFSGAITANINVLLSSPVPKVWTVANNTTGAFTLTVKNASGGTGVIVPAGSSLMVYSDGTNVVAASQPVDASGNSFSGSGFSTGDVKPTFKPTPDAGWVFANDGTIGDASSSATNRANADCQSLFMLFWNSYSNAICPVLPSRGASAAADWAAHKRITLPPFAGRVLGVVGSGSGLTSRSLGDTAGEETHRLTVPEMPSHSHLTFGGTAQVQGAIDNKYAPYNTANNQPSSSVGGDQPHNNMQPTTFINLMIKL